MRAPGTRRHRLAGEPPVRTLNRHPCGITPCSTNYMVRPPRTDKIGCGRRGPDRNSCDGSRHRPDPWPKRNTWERTARRSTQPDWAPIARPRWRDASRRPASPSPDCRPCRSSRCRTGRKLHCPGCCRLYAVMAGTDLSYGPPDCWGGLVFSLGLVLVIVAGAELFTGNALIVMAWVDRKIRLRDLLRNWAVSFAGNAAGAAAIVVLMAMAGLLKGQAGDLAIRIAEAKAGLGWTEALARGILCNMLFALPSGSPSPPGTWRERSCHPAADLGFRSARLRALDRQSLPYPRRLDRRGLGRMGGFPGKPGAGHPRQHHRRRGRGRPHLSTGLPAGWLTKSVGCGFRRRLGAAALFGVDRFSRRV